MKSYLIQNAVSQPLSGLLIRIFHLWQYANPYFARITQRQLFEVSLNFKFLIFVFIFASCQSPIKPVTPHYLKKTITTGYIFKRLNERVAKIKDIKSFTRTTFLGQNLKQTIRQALLIQGIKSIRVDSYGLFGQSKGVFTYHNGKTVFFDPAKNRYYSGLEVQSIMNKVLGTRLDFREHLRVFVGHIPRLEFLEVLDSRLSSDQTHYIVLLKDLEREENVTINFSALTLLPSKMVRERKGRSMYSVEWQEYARIEGVYFSHLVTLSFPDKQDVIRVNFKEPVINKGLPVDTFKFAESASFLSLP